MKRFLISIILFLVFLISIPLLLGIGWNVAAKIMGVVIVVSLSISIRYWMYRTKMEYNPMERVRINLNDRFWMRKELSFYSALGPSDKKSFEDRIGVVLSKVPIFLSSGELLFDRQSALRVVASIVQASDWSNELHQQLPNAIIIEGDFWVKTMEELSAQTNVKVLKLDSV